MLVRVLGQAVQAAMDEGKEGMAGLMGDCQREDNRMGKYTQFQKELGFLLCVSWPGMPGKAAHDLGRCSELVRYLYV
jgi:hypothetical protein